MLIQMGYIKIFTGLLFGLYLLQTFSQDFDPTSNAIEQRLNLPDSSFLQSILEIPYDKYTANLIQSEKLFLEALGQAKMIGDTIKTGEVYARLAIISYLRGDYDKSVEYNQKAIELFLAREETAKAGFSYCEMGYQMKRRNMDMALYYMRQGITLLENTQPLPNMSAPYDNYGVLQEMVHQYDSSLHFYHKALAIKKRINDSIGIPFSLNNIAQTYMLQEKYDSAKIYFDRAFEIRKSRNDLFGMIENYGFYGDFFLAQKNYNDAINFYLQGHEKTKQSGYLYMRQYISGKLSICYENTGNLPLSLKYQRENQKILDSLINQETNNKIAQLEVQFRTVEKEKELEKKAKEMAILNQQKARQKFIISGISGVSVIIFLLFLLFFQRYRQKQQLQLQSILLKEKERGMKAIIQAEEEERNRIARELHDGIGQKISGLKLGWEGFGKKYLKENIGAKSELKRLSDILNDSSVEVRSISHQMMPKALKDVGLEAAISDMLGSAFKNSKIQFKLNTFGIDGRFDITIEITVFRACQELINNIIKYADAKKIEIHLYKSKNNLILSVEDDGKGFDINAKKAGIGLTNIKSRVENVKGSFHIESEKSKGTRATIRIPL
jgi:signal transduction histidine kinase